jgi:thiol:disulfide interchange protein DsbC
MKTTLTERLARRTAIGLFAASAGLGCLPALAQSLAHTSAPGELRPAAQASVDMQTLAARLQALYPATRFGSVNPTVWPGVYEVSMGANLAYVDESGRYFLFGHLYDMRVQRDLTAGRKDALARIDFPSLPLQDAIRDVRGNGSRTLAVFSDPDCPHCRRLETELRGVSDVTIHTFLMPLASLHPGAHRKSVSVWCAGDRLAAWRELMLRQREPLRADCAHPVDRNLALAEKLGIQGTPTLIAEDGRVMAGAGNREQIEAWLARTTRADSAPSEGSAP